MFLHLACYTSFLPLVGLIFYFLPIIGYWKFLSLLAIIYTVFDDFIIE